MGMVYKWKPKANFHVKAEIAGNEIERIRIKNGGAVTPMVLVKESTPSNTPLHKCFEWNNAKAADAYRTTQARQILRLITITFVDGDEKSEPVRAFVNVVSGDKQFYTSTVYAMSDEELRNQVLDQALGEIENWTKIYNAYDEFSELIGVIQAEAKKARRRLPKIKKAA